MKDNDDDYHGSDEIPVGTDDGDMVERRDSGDADAERPADTEDA